jgi:photosystem II stability/assembly factor-like uncharacterized protein
LLYLQQLFYSENFCQMKQITLALFLIFLLLQSCKKDDNNTGSTTPPSILPPSEMLIVSGNNQTGYPNRVLTDSIIIKITPRKAEDITSYSFLFTPFTGLNIASRTSVVNVVYYVKAAWTLSAAVSPQQIKFFLYGNCTNPYSGSCTALDSLPINATVNGRQWTKVYDDNSGITSSGAFWDIHFSDALHGIAIGDFKTGLFKTQDAGATWTVAPNSRNDLYQLSFADNNTGLVTVTNNWAYFTNDGGNTFVTGPWTPPLVGHLSSADFFMADRNTIYSVGRNAGIVKSVDGGQSWTQYQGFNFVNWLNAITCIGKDTCYACGEAAKIIKTSNGGITWTEQNVLLNNYLKTVYFLNANFGFLAGLYGALISTTDGGSNWAIINTGLRFDILDIRFFGNSTGFIVSSGGEIAKTTDGGLSWQIIVRDNYGVYSLNKALIKDATIVFGLQNQNIFTYDLR